MSAIDTLRRLALPERLAAIAGLAAAGASLAGFIPGLYRDPPVIVAQSHGYDIGNLAGVVLLWLGLVAAANGSTPGRLIAIGALGSLLYSYVTYAFLIVLNPATVLYIAVLGLGGWAVATGLLAVDEDEVDAALAGRLPRRTTAVFFLALALLFAVNWLGQISGSITSGHLPAELEAAGWPMNPVFVLDLAFVLPLMALTGIRLLTHPRRGARVAIPLLVFTPLLGLSILSMSLWAAVEGQALEPGVAAIFIAVTVVSATLAWITLSPSRLNGNSS